MSASAKPGLAHALVKIISAPAPDQLAAALMQAKLPLTPAPAKAVPPMEKNLLSERPGLPPSEPLQVFSVSEVFLKDGDVSSPAAQCQWSDGPR